ncbi:MAG: oligosaccharide flippase family protein [Coriobacteriaceae bacterium]|nr:flippase [Coriobacteriaceae bacterium]MDO4890291.1 oligosaccharide flippase family protein [Coriobacteriaceae bacterium]
MPDRSRLAKNTAFQYGLQLAKYLFPFVTVAYLTRTLGPDTYAIRAYVMAAMTFMLMFLEFGFTVYGTKSIAEAGSVDEERIETSAITYTRIGLSAVGAVALVPITLALPIMAANPLYVAIAYVGTCFKAYLPDYIFRGQEDMGIITYRYVVSQIVAVGLIFLMVNGPQDLLLVPILEGLGALIALVWSWENVVRKRGITLVRVSGQRLKAVFGESTVYFISTASTGILSSITLLFIGYFITDAAQVSYWSIAMTAVVAVQALYSPITNSLFPHMVKRRDFDILKKLMMVGMPVVLVGTIAFALLNNVIMLLLGGEEYLEGAYMIALVSPILFFSYPAQMLGTPVLAAVGRVRQMTASSVTACLFQIIGLCLLAATGMFTIEAVAVLRCSSEAVLFGVRAFFTWRYFRETRAMAAQED